MNKLAKLGLLGLLCMKLAGCASVPYTRTELVEYKKPLIVINEEKRVSKGILEENLIKVGQEDYKINSTVEETRTDIIEEVRTVRRDTVKRVDTITDGSDSILGVPCVGWTPTNVIKGQEQVYSETSTESSENKKIIYQSKYIEGIPVKFSSMHFKFENNLETIITNTNGGGIAVAEIKYRPLLWRASEKELARVLSANLQDQIKDDSIRGKIIDSLKINEVSYPINIETVKKGSIVQDGGNTYYVEVKNDKKKFNVTGYQPDLGALYGYIQNLIIGDLKERCLSHIYIQVRDIESHFPINDAIINLNQKKTIPMERLLAEEENIRRRYFVEGSEFFEGTKVDVSPLMIDLSGSRSISSGGLELVSNFGSAYDVEVTHPQYRFLQGELSFDKKTNSKTIEMISLGSKIRTQETQEKGGRVIDTK